MDTNKKSSDSLNETQSLLVIKEMIQVSKTNSNETEYYSLFGVGYYFLIISF